MNDLDRFLSKVKKHPGGCWEWLAGRSSNGYGEFRTYGISWLAHRFSYINFVSNIPLTTQDYICHSCNNKGCVNPEHLFLGDAGINARHAHETGVQAKPNQRHGRKDTGTNIFGKGISFDESRGNFKCSIRVGDIRYQARKATLTEAIAWREYMENLYWGNNNDH